MSVPGKHSPSPLRKLKYVATFGNGRDHKPLECDSSGYPVYGSGGHFAYATDYLHDGESVLFGRKGTIDRPLYVNERFWTVDTMYYTTISSTVVPKFIYYAALTIPFALYSTNTALPSITQEVLGKHKIPCPPYSEQTQIAKFLDYETARIDALIEKQEQLIRLLKEKRQAVISHAVTKGLNPDAPMRDSGIEWLGEVPAHWGVKRLKHLFAESLRNGISPQSSENGGVLTFSIAAVRDGVVNVKSHLKQAGISLHAAHPYWIQEGDVMMIRGNGSRDLVGTVGIIEELPSEDCIYPDILIRLRFSKAVDSRLAVLFLNSTVSRPQVAMGAKTAAGIWKVSGATVSEFAMPLPPPAEQRDILYHLGAALSKIDSLVIRASEQGTLLRERRTALISAAVTGKIDVRDWQPPTQAKAEVA